VLLDMDSQEDYRKIAGIFRRLCHEGTKGDVTG
jgi:hypothetical protein